jgi:hypothetical protein
VVPTLDVEPPTCCRARMSVAGGNAGAAGAMGLAGRKEGLGRVKMAVGVELDACGRDVEEIRAVIFGRVLVDRGKGVEDVELLAFGFGVLERGEAPPCNGVCEVELEICGRDGKPCPGPKTEPGSGVELVEGALLPPLTLAPADLIPLPLPTSFSFPTRLLPAFLRLTSSSTTALHTLLSPSITTIIGFSGLETDTGTVAGIDGETASKEFI